MLASVSDVSFDEDLSGSLSLSADDVDGDVLTYSITGGSDITATLDGSDVSFSTTENYNGSEVFNVSVSDGEYTDSQSITVTVNAINDAPVATSASVETAEDQSVVVSLSGSDIDGDNLTFSLDSDASYGSVSLNGSLATYTPSTNYNGDDSFTFSVSDGSESSSASVTLSVTAVNDAPVLASVSDVSFDEDLSGSLSLSADDIDGDELTYSITGGSDIVASLNGGNISFSAPANYNGSESFTVSVTDGIVTDSQSITVTVNAVNDLPLSFSDEFITSEDESITISLSAQDIDGDNLIFSIINQPSNGLVLIDGSFAVYTPDNNYYGSDSFSFVANDGFGNSNVSIISLTINPVNDALILEQINNISFDEDGSTSLLLSANDIDGDELFYSISEGDQISATLIDNEVIFTAPENFNGSENFTASVTDGLVIDLQTFTVTVNAINDAPIATDLNANTFEDESIIVILDGNDIDGDNLTFSLDSDALNGSVTLNGSLATYTPNANYFGDDTFNFSVSDGVESSSASVSVSVTAVNDAPVLASVSDVSFDEDLSGSLSLSADDVDGDELSYSITGGSDIAATLNGSDVSFSAPTNYNGSEVFNVSVSDGTVSDSQSFTVAVNAVNDAPVANATSSTTVEDQSVVVTLSGSDVDGDNLTFSLDSDAANGSVVIDGSFATYTPNANYFGDDSFTFSVSDGVESSSASVSVSVSAVNDAPVLAAVSDVSFDEDLSGILSLSADDVDGDELTYSITGGSDIICNT